MVWAGRARVKAKHAVVCAALSAVLAVIGITALVSLQPGQGMFGVVLGLVAFGALGLALSLLAATASIGVALLRGGTRSSNGSIRKYEHVPLADEHRRWQQEARQPNASYQDFLNKAHPRHFPTAIVSLVIAALAMVLVFALIFHR